MSTNGWIDCRSETELLTAFLRQRNESKKQDGKLKAEQIVEQCYCDGIDKPIVRYVSYFCFRRKPSYASSDLTDCELLQAAEDPNCTRAIRVLDFYSTGTLSITELCGQQWCEQQVVFKQVYPIITTEEGQSRHVNDRPEVHNGAAAHEKREQTLQQREKVRCFTRADRIAVDVLNCINSFSRLLLASWRRKDVRVLEVPVFGEWPCEGELIYLRGVVDEITIVDGELSIVEFKTTNKCSQHLHASHPIVRMHHFQMAVYAFLFERMIRDTVDFSDRFLRGNNVNGLRSLNKAILELYRQRQLEVTCLYDCLALLEILLRAMDVLLPVKHLRVEYDPVEASDDQASKVVIYFKHSTSWVMNKLCGAEAFWLGKRSPNGVDIEECWKCDSCPYTDKCEWYNKSKSPETKPQNKLCT